MATPLIELTNLTFRYRGDPKTAVQDINLCLSEPQPVALLGGSGSGKSTLLKIMAGFIPGIIKGHLRGNVLINGIPADRLDITRRAQTVTLLFSDPLQQLSGTCMTVEEEIAWGLENLGLPHDEMHRRVKRTLKQFSLTELSQRHPLSLSGGQQQRVALAAVTVTRPRIILLDEPTAMLDPRGREHVKQAVSELVKQGHLVIWATPNLEEVSWCDRWLILEDGKLLYEGPPQYDLPSQQTGRVLFPSWFRLQNTLQKSGINLTLPPTDLSTLTSRLQERFRNLPIPSLTHHCTHYCTPKSQLPDACWEGVKARKVYFRYPTGVQAISDLSCELAGKSHLAMLGANGSGKTTLARLIKGLLVPDQGDIIVGTCNTKLYAAHHLAAQIGYLFQNPKRQIFCASVEEELAFGPRNLGWTEQEIRKAVETVLEITELTQHRHTHPYELSRALQRRLAWGSVLTMKPHLIIADEPTASLDRKEYNWLQQLLNNLEAQNITVMLITHDMDFAADHLSQALVMHNGTLAYYDETTSVFARLYQDPDLGYRTLGLAPPVAQTVAIALGLPPRTCTTLTLQTVLTGQVQEN